MNCIIYSECSNNNFEITFFHLWPALNLIYKASKKKEENWL